MKSMLFGLALVSALSGCCGWCKKKSCEKPCKTEKVSKTSVVREDKDMGMKKSKK